MATTNRQAAGRTFNGLGSVLLLFVGLLNFHIPHFLLESVRAPDTPSAMLELFLLATLVATVIAAIGIARGQRLGWQLGICIAVIFALLWVLQETVGLPGLPKQWNEPSRIVSLLLDAAFTFLAIVTLRRASPPTSVSTLSVG